MSVEPRHQFYETDEKVTINIFVKGADSAQVKVDLQPRSAAFEYQDQKLGWDPLVAEIIPEQSGFRIASVKVELWLVKKLPGRWGALAADPSLVDEARPIQPTPSARSTSPDQPKAQKKNWDKVAATAFEAEKAKEKTISDDPNAGGDTAVNEFFQQIYAGADEDARRAMMKSFTESGGTTLSTNWKEVGTGKVETKPPKGSEAKKW